MSQNVIGQTRLSSETLGKFTSESTLVTPEPKPAKPVRGSMLLAKGKSESHSSGSQKQHHQHSSETPQVQSRVPQGRAGILLLSILQPRHHSITPVGALTGQPQHCFCTTAEKGVHPAGAVNVIVTGLDAGRGKINTAETPALTLH